MTPINQSIVRSFVGPERVKSFQQTNVCFVPIAVIQPMSALRRMRILITT